MITWSVHSGRADPIKRSTYPFCQGERYDVGRSRIPIARTRALNATPNARSLSRMRYFGALSQGNASVIWRASHSAVGLRVTANHSNRRRSCPRTRNAKSCWNAIVRTTNSLGRPKQRHAPTSAFTPRSRAQKVADLHKNPRIDRSDDAGLAEVGSRISF